MSTPQLKPVANPAPSRMTLKALIKGKQKQPIRAIVFGQEGCGKSTFAANSPDPIFLCGENGTAHLDVVRFPTPTTWQEVLDSVRTLETEEHAFRTLVIDTLDWIEPLCWAKVCETGGKDGKKVDTIEEACGGYAKGYIAAVDQWRILVAGLERLMHAKQMNVLLLAHSNIKVFKNPEGEDYERWEMKLHHKAAGLLKEWSDAVLFARFETFAKKDAQKRVRGVSTGSRIICTERTAAYDAKNRYVLPETLPLAWSDFAAAVESHKPADPVALKSEIERKVKQVGGEVEKTGLAALAKAEGDASKLAQLNSWANAKLAEKEN